MIDSFLYEKITESGVLWRETRFFISSSFRTWKGWSLNGCRSAWFIYTIVSVSFARRASLGGLGWSVVGLASAFSACLLSGVGGAALLSGAVLGGVLAVVFGTVGIFAPLSVALLFGAVGTVLVVLSPILPTTPFPSVPSLIFAACGFLSDFTVSFSTTLGLNDVVCLPRRLMGLSFSSVLGMSAVFELSAFGAVFAFSTVCFAAACLSSPPVMPGFVDFYVPVLSASVSGFSASPFGLSGAGVEIGVGARICRLYLVWLLPAAVYQLVAWVVQFYFRV